MVTLRSGKEERLKCHFLDLLNGRKAVHTFSTLKRCMDLMDISHCQANQHAGRRIYLNRPLCIVHRTKKRFVLQAVNACPARIIRNLQPKRFRKEMLGLFQILKIQERNVGRYGYLPKPMKKLVDEIVDQMARLPTVDACYQTWWELQCQVEDYYSEGKKRLRPPLSQQKEFRQIKNAVIREAEHIRMNRFSFEDEEMQDNGEQISTYAMSYACQDLQSVANDDRFPLEEHDEAAEQLEQLAEDGDAYALYIIGTAYRDGGLLIPDMVKARKLLEHAAEQGLDAAQYALGKLYLSDDADVHDPAKGIYWLKRSADNGNDFAAYRLGKEYLSGNNVSKDASTAAEYLRQAANNGNAYAQYLLGKLTLMGEGVPKDMDAAYEWFAAAQENGHAYASFFIDRIERGEQHPPSVVLSATRLLYHMGNIFRDNAPAMPTVGGIHIDRKRLQELQRKRIALGHKPDDHELEQQQGFSMKFHM